MQAFLKDSGGFAITLSSKAPSMCQGNFDAWIKAVKKSGKI